MRHFYNMHGFLGITGYSLFCVQYLFSVITFFAVDVPAPRAFAMPYHKYLGIVIFFFVWGALFSGVIDRQRIQFGDSEQTPNYKLSNALGAFIALSAACLLYHFSPASRAGNKDGGESERLL
jgi:hypothetical protein